MRNEKYCGGCGRYKKNELFVTGRIKKRPQCITCGEKAAKHSSRAGVLETAKKSKKGKETILKR